MGLPGSPRAIEDAHYPADLRGPRRRPPPARLRRAPGAPARHGRPAPPARPRAAAVPIAIDDASDADVRAALTRRAGASGSGGEVDADRRPGRRHRRRSATTSPGATPMLRLLQGDVGSGKTAVAAYALAAAARAGFQGALLAPTDLLARQHLETVGALLEALGIGVTLLTGSLKADVQGQGARGDRVRARRPVVVGTHALIQDAVSFARPRPGRHRRAAPLRRRPARRARGQGRRPLAARPADDRDADPADARPGALRRPRRLGPADAARRPGPDPDRDPPPGRPRRDVAKVRDEAAAGHRTFVVVPLIEEGVDDGDGRGRGRDRGGPAGRAARPAARRDGPRPAQAGRARRRDDAGSATASSTSWSARPSSRSASTCPTATMMVIEGADRFGLAQLHQLRGRVGRGTRRVVLRPRLRRRPTRSRRPGSRRSPRSHDGFELAEKDFELRKEGDVLGLAQSGLPAPARRLAPGRRASRPRGPGARPRRGAPRRRRADGAAGAER